MKSINTALSFSQECFRGLSRLVIIVYTYMCVQSLRFLLLFFECVLFGWPSLKKMKISDVQFENKSNLTQEYTSPFELSFSIDIDDDGVIPQSGAAILEVNYILDVVRKESKIIKFKGQPICLTDNRILVKTQALELDDIKASQLSNVGVLELLLYGAMDRNKVLCSKKLVVQLAKQGARIVRCVYTP